MHVAVAEIKRQAAVLADPAELADHEAVVDDREGEHEENAGRECDRGPYESARANEWHGSQQHVEDERRPRHRREAAGEPGAETGHDPALATGALREPERKHEERHARCFGHEISGVGDVDGPGRAEHRRERGGGS